MTSKRARFNDSFGTDEGEVILVRIFDLISTRGSMPWPDIAHTIGLPVDSVEGLVRQSKWFHVDDESKNVQIAVTGG